MLTVLRRAHGDDLEIVDSSGRAYAASLVVDGPRVRAALGAQLSAPARTRLEITLAQGLPKGAKMDYVVEKATELGIVRILPFVSSRSVAEGAREGKRERWSRIAKSAAQQSGRATIPDIEAPLAFDALLARFASFDRALVPWELADGIPLRERLPPLLTGVRTVVVTIGPEGGLSADEAAAARAAGGHLLSLGSRILRTETAGLVACAALYYETSDL